MLKREEPLYKIIKSMNRDGIEPERILEVDPSITLGITYMEVLYVTSSN